MGKIFVLITGPLETKKAINKASFLAKEFSLELVVINVIDKESLAKLERYKIFIEEETSLLKDNLLKDAEKYLNYAKKIAEQYNIKISTHILEGDPFLVFEEFITHDSDKVKLVCISKKFNEEGVLEGFGIIERKILTKTNFDIIIAGE